jgi:TolB-like protein
MALGAQGRVWVAPFDEVGAADKQVQPNWINRALRQSIIDDLSSVRGVTVATPAASGAMQSPATQPADVDYIVRGTIQRVDGDLRVSGRVEQAGADKTIGGFKASGTERDLFSIEDSIASQLRLVFAPPPAPAVAAATTAPSNPFSRPGMFEGSDLQRALEDRDYLRRLQNDYEPAPTYGYTQPVYPAGYSYSPYGGYGGYWWGGGWDGNSVIIINNRSGRDHHRGGRGRFDGNGTSSGGTFVVNPVGGQDAAIRRAASWAGNPPSTFVHEAFPGPQWVPGGMPASSGTVGAGGTGPSVNGGGGGRAAALQSPAGTLRR